MPVLVPTSMLSLVHLVSEPLSHFEDQTSLVGILVISSSTVLLILQSLGLIAERRYTVQETNGVL